MLHSIEVGPLNIIHSDVLKRLEAVENVEAYILEPIVKWNFKN